MEIRFTHVRVLRGALSFVVLCANTKLVIFYSTN